MNPNQIVTVLITRMIASPIRILADSLAIGNFDKFLKKAIEYMTRDYTVPQVEDSIIRIEHNDRPNWKMLVTTPDGVFPSLQHAGEYYNVTHSTIRGWCLENSKWKREGFSCQKMFISLNQLKDYCNVKNQSC
jgi:hypothetical protein